MCGQFVSQFTAVMIGNRFSKEYVRLSESTFYLIEKETSFKLFRIQVLASLAAKLQIFCYGSVKPLSNLHSQIFLVDSSNIYCHKKSSSTSLSSHKCAHELLNILN